MYIIKVDLINQVVRFLLLLVLHQLTLQVQVINFLSTSHLFIISSSQIFIVSPHHLINFLSLHLIILSTHHLFIFFSFSPFNFSSSHPYISSQPPQNDHKIIPSQLSMRLRQDPGVEQAKGESQNNSCQGSILTSNGSFHGMK